MATFLAIYSILSFAMYFWMGLVEAEKVVKDGFLVRHLIMIILFPLSALFALLVFLIILILANIIVSIKSGKLNKFLNKKLF